MHLIKNTYHLISLILFLTLSGLALARTNTSEEINLHISEATTLHYQTPIDTVFIADAQIADYQVVEGNRLIIYGKTVGSSSLIVLGDKGIPIDKKQLTVKRNLSSIKEYIHARYPDINIELAGSGNQTVLSGKVTSEESRQEIYNLTGELLGSKVTEEKISWKDGSVQGNNIRFMTRRTYEGLINNLQVNTVKQINVKLTIAEVSHSFIRQLGVKWGSEIGGDKNAVFLGNGQFYNKVGHISSNTIANYISAADDDAMGQILAQPNLSVLSGESASFLAGGEMPIVTFVDGSQNITYKQFGIRLTLAAKAQADDTINLSLEPEVSSIDPSNSNNQLNIPAFKTRRTRTTIQLADGESFVLGGLLSTEDREALSKVPFVGDIPLFGAAFRHTGNQRKKTELIIVATVNLVKPVASGTIQLPQINHSSILLRYFNLDSARANGAINDQAKSILAAGGFKE
ncbi:type II and III secretion system protein family protein [Sansalvadorimonas verongulae]|uniref:type II and III secretion system protein family protein n=1 Tax=Sansalvadorimonas verongulae TaxID=2172824 RepID=UPI0012BC0E46|nr:pilus assembly protein N-terminal domain-containing protein [Sansalvadorimonas verongulae]MTI15557.1 general secretion pathway protein GspD [Sansalvadorimonas verongulae]